ncbi:hypothetical protein BD289DRAFT_365276 [Coniella lustricola]|uniref:ATP-dependent DNA helicase n=1 Tax=Coniella lustricola TaxID=2025994 RepID=A0A2T3ACF8_9PEZI|nr:hypothetical protein BD289DRAFT_365276 [Coniella lustricola]
MDSYDWDDGLADEDLINALTQASQGDTVKPQAKAAGIGEDGQKDLDSHIANSNLPHYNVPSSGSSRASPAQPSDQLEPLPLDLFEISPPQTRRNAKLVPRSSEPSRVQNLRQTTLWGEAVAEGQQLEPRSQLRTVYRADSALEPQTHHKLDHDALKTWIYPTNLGPIRDYQFSIVKNGLFNNTLVALPTGLGKTFIAATVMLNYFRWTKDSKIIFVTPTKPLASQQVDACLNVAGIPRSQATLLTGEISPSLREEEWEKRRIFFMTPQTLQNDLSKGYADPKSIVLLVIDEAHRATGDYAYVKVVEFIRRFNPSFRVLALTATPGSTVEGVQAVIDSLGISTIEIRTEESIDIRSYVHSREVDQIILEPSDEMLQVQELFSKTLRPLCNKLARVNKWLARDPMTLTVMGLREAQRQWALGAGRHANQATKGMVIAVFTILQSIAHAIKLLNYHGIAPFYHKMLDFRKEVEGQGSKGSKNKKQIIQDANFQEMMDTITKWQRLDGFVGHPKLSYLCENLLNHFMDAGSGSSTRAIVFSEYRDSAEEIVRTLDKHKPMINASIFVGQADSKRSEGMKQKQQVEVIKKFTAGDFNVLVATSIGEEGLDIGQVDLIICYDASASPIRMLQRMGRTGRKRAGNITLLLMKGREEEQYRKAKDNYEKMQRFICQGTRFNFRNDLSSRIVPRDARPEVDKRMVEIPIENTQDRSLPEPTKRGAARKKAIQKKFHMPDGVITGFMKASDVGRSATTGTTTGKKKSMKPQETAVLAEIPPLDGVLLDRDQILQLDRTYRNYPSHCMSQEEITGPDLGAQPQAQRKLRPVVKLRHGAHAKRCVKLFKRLADAQSPLERHVHPYDDDQGFAYENLPLPEFAQASNGDDSLEELSAVSDLTSKKRPRAFLMNQDKSSSLVDLSIDEEEDDDRSNTDESMETENQVATGKRTRAKAKPKAKARKKKAKPRCNNDLVEDYGDDCTRTSQLHESDGSDDGADLVDFIDDGPLSSIQNVPSTPTLAPSSPVLRRPTSNRTKGKRSYEPLSSQLQDSDDDSSSLSQLGGESSGQGNSKSLPTALDADEEDGEEHAGFAQKRSIGNRKRPTVIEESDYE